MGGLDRLCIFVVRFPGERPASFVTDQRCRHIEYERVLSPRRMHMNYGTRSKMATERKVSEFYISLINLSFC